MSNYVLKHHGIRGMKWGVRRYQNPDGTLTDAGKKRYDSEIRRNNAKSKKNRGDEDALRDPNKWVKDDLNATKQILDSSGKLVKDVKQLNDSSKKKNPRLDLSNKSDKELRDEINRELLERQYNDVFNKPNVSKGRKAVEKTLDVAGTVIPLAGGIVTIAIGINELKKG